jgi:nicotinate-nucleotide pyrophosphorylase (carboxylating)
MADYQRLSARLSSALAEDGARNDATTQLLPGYQRTPVSAVLLAKERGVFCGSFLFRPIFGALDPRFSVRILKRDGATVRPGDKIAVLRGRTGAILAGERIFLNLACRLSGIATLTRCFADKVRGTSARIYDTRKTTPLWRDLEKKAVVSGGGYSNRFSLSDAVLVKDNHLQAARRQGLNIADVFGRTAIRSRRRLKFVEIEAASLPDVRDALACEPDIILLDNMPVKLLKESIALIKSARTARGSSTPQIEISGGVTLSHVRTLARLGVDRISVGALTHSAPSLDLSLEVL